MTKLTRYWRHGMIALLCMSMACTQAQVDAVLSDADLILQASQNLGAAIGALSPADADKLKSLTDMGINGIQLIQKEYDTYEANKTQSNLNNVLAAVNTLQANLPQELATLHISNANAVQKATAWVTLVTDFAAFVVREVSAISNQPAARTTRTMTLSMPTPESLQARWRSEVCQGDAACGALVHVRHKHLKRRLL